MALPESRFPSVTPRAAATPTMMARANKAQPTDLMSLLRRSVRSQLSATSLMSSFSEYSKTSRGLPGVAGEVGHVSVMDACESAATGFDRIWGYDCGTVCDGSEWIDDVGPAMNACTPLMCEPMDESELWLVRAPPGSGGSDRMVGNGACGGRCF